jgi:hypothetical protein
MGISTKSQTRKAAKCSSPTDNRGAQMEIIIIIFVGACWVGGLMEIFRGRK